jgi:endo-beta-N-acetylglucosaminidase D
MNKTLRTYAIVFTLKQYDTKTEWVSTLLQQGINAGESIEGMQIVDLTQYYSEKARIEND